MTKASITVDQLCLAYPAARRHGLPVQVLDKLSFQVEAGRFACIVGPNGCGKSTLLQVIAGLLEPDTGMIQIGSTGPSDGLCGYVFQNYKESLYPWYTTGDNIAIARVFQGWGWTEARAEARGLLQRLSLDLPIDRYPYQLSGGQQQLVAIARSLLLEPPVLLLDEPFGSLDYLARWEMRDALLRIWTTTRATAVLVTHDVDEAIYIGDRVVTLSERPARVLAVHDVSLTRPRTQEVTTTAEFGAVRHAVLTTLDHHRKR